MPRARPGQAGKDLFEVALVVALAAGLTVALTWPLAARPGSTGRIDSGDGRFAVWSAVWVARALSSAPSTLFDANIFHPHDNALAFSEPNIVAGALAVPVWLGAGNALAAGNSVVFVSFVLAAVAMFLLARYLTGCTAASVLAALFFAFSPYAFSRLPHIHLLLTFGLPLSLLAMHRLIDAPGAWRAVALGVALALTGLSSGYYGIFAGLATGWGLLWFAVVTGQWADRRFWLWSAAAIGVAALITAPFIVPFAQMRADGFARSVDDARMFSADWRSYLASPMLSQRWLLPHVTPWRDVLFPGAMAIVFAIATLVLAARRPRPAVWSLTIIGFYASLTGLALWASFGPDAGLYRLLFETLPFFDLIRAPARLGLVVTTGCAALAAFSLARLFAGLAATRAITIAGLGIATIAAADVGRLHLATQSPRPVVYERLAHMPRGGVAEFPYFVGSADRHRHTEYMLASTWHWQPLINGYSDHTPPDALEDDLMLATFPDPDAWEVLRRRGARYIVVHWGMFPPGTDLREAISHEVGRRLRVVVDRDNATLFEIVGW